MKHTVEFFGVRHHSPTAALLVAERIKSRPPAAVLIEGPTEFNPAIQELSLDHTLPIMIYSWAPQDEGRRGVYYPLSSYSPEWLALRAAMAAGIPVRFIDAPFYLINDDEEPSPASNRVSELCRKFGVDDLDAAIDELIDVAGNLSYDEYCHRMEMLGSILRREDAAGQQRERFMADRIREMQALTDGTILVVCGAAHIDGLRAELSHNQRPAQWQQPEDDRYGSALTPTSYAALDALRGYRAGQPNPGFYAALFDDRSRGIRGTAERLLMELITELRQAKQRVSVADAIAVLTTARGLAALRGHDEVWRTDLLDAMTASLVKDNRGEDHPLIERIRTLLRGTEVGALAAGSTRPPLVVELLTELETLGLKPEVTQRLVSIDVSKGPAQSQLLHSLLVLGVAGVTLTESAQRNGVETWQLGWIPEFESTLVEAARYGGNREEAVITRLLERLGLASDDPEFIADVLLAALQCGVHDLVQTITMRCSSLIGQARQLTSLGAAMNKLVDAYRFGGLSGNSELSAIGDLIVASHARFCELLLALPPASDEEATDIVLSLRSPLQAMERGASLDLSATIWRTALVSTARDQEQALAVRGAATGALWVMEDVATTRTGAIEEQLNRINSPVDLGEFVFGLLQLAREVVTRRPEFVDALDEELGRLSPAQFLAALPGLRRAFAAYPPRERADIAARLLGDTAVKAVADFDIDEFALAEVISFEHYLLDRLSGYLGVDND
ncbi:hypothetical protein CKALI_05670 [Corynebacterium kalinowskii]|uniref:Uncharacterized protein n=1 Tax=Corynebacterium kalinowskii TaxID=2675216 RepID=A0A6B8VKK0_9CORY|nr:DUF5682 family protein [Corynebacterium kalinowskii]QGU02004.1 hypothetical protein CKALI_05670 [Corynebacterium kalinowskii]